MSEQSPHNQQRKTLSFTHRQVGYGGAALLTAFTIMASVKGSFVTREEWNAQLESTKRIEQLIKDQGGDIRGLETKLTDNTRAFKDEIVHKIERSNDFWKDNARETALRLDHRIDSLEASVFHTNSRSKN